MKAWIVNDIHATNVGLAQLDRLEIPEADVCLCAGDTSGIVEMSIEFLKRHIVPHMPVVTVLGNHEYYGATIDITLKTAKRDAGPSITVLENETVLLNNVRIIGATLWTDFQIEHGVNGEELPVKDRRSYAIQVCKQYMTDFHAIYSSSWSGHGMPRLLTAKELINRHTKSRDFIRRELEKPYGGRTLVLTHHAPSPRSLHPAFRGHPSNAAFASDLTDLIHKGQPDFWVHGHVHHFFDYQEGVTRVLCNPRGYRRERLDTGFVPTLVIDI